MRNAFGYINDTLPGIGEKILPPKWIEAHAIKFTFFLSSRSARERNLFSTPGVCLFCACHKSVAILSVQNPWVNTQGIPSTWRAAAACRRGWWTLVIKVSSLSAGSCILVCAQNADKSSGKNTATGTLDLHFASIYHPRGLIWQEWKTLLGQNRVPVSLGWFY